MKRKAAAALALLMTVSMLAGCGSDGGDKGKKSDGKTTLTFWCHQNEPWVKSYEAMAEKFEKEHPEYTVEEHLFFLWPIFRRLVSLQDGFPILSRHNSDRVREQNVRIPR